MDEVVATLVAVFVGGYFLSKILRQVLSTGLDARGQRPWNRKLSDELRAALAAGLDAFQNREPGVSVDWDVGRLTRSDPAGFVSLAALCDTLAVDPEALLADRDGAVQDALSELWEGGAAGVLPLTESWYEPSIDGLSADRFAETAYDVLVSTLSPGLVTHSFDPLRGALTLGVEPPDQATYENRTPTNELWVDLSALVRDAHRRRSAGDGRELAEILRESLERGVRDGAEGVAWLLGDASRIERDVAIACLHRRS